MNIVSFRIGAETASQPMQVLRTNIASPQGFHALSRGLIPWRTPANPVNRKPLTLTPFADLVHLNTNRITNLSLW